jgi:hypothetical protein
LAQRNRTRAYSSDYAALIGVTVLAFCIGVMTGCRACEPTGYVRLGPASFRGVGATEVMAGVRCEWRE